ncbi:MAG: hypothetical protein ACJ77K_11695 [Bacteroidia bacterium]
MSEHRKLKQLFPIFAALVLLSCGQATDKSLGESAARKAPDNMNVKPFVFVVKNSDYSMAYSLQYILSDKELRIIFSGELEGEHDSTLFQKDMEPSEELSKLSNVNIDSLKELYQNPCVMDGSQIIVQLIKDGKEKTVQLSNYYQPDIGRAIELINSLTPKKYKIWYDKDELLKEQENCK